MIMKRNVSCAAEQTERRFFRLFFNSKRCAANNKTRIVKKGGGSVFAAAVLVCSLMCAALILAGCSTSVAFDVVKPAEVNMSQYRTLGILEFSADESATFSRSGYILFNQLLRDERESGYTGTLSYEVADYLTDSVTRTLEHTDYFTVVPSFRLRPVLSAQQYGPNQSQTLQDTFGIDALIIGAVEDMDFDEDYVTRVEKVWDEETESMVEVYAEYLVQEVELSVSYSVVAVEDGRILATKRLNGSRVRETKVPSDPEEQELFTAPKLFPLYQQIIQGFMPEIRNQLAPSFVREHRTLAKDKMDDPRMEEAEELVKQDQYSRALSLYLNIWYENGNYAAGYNAAILYEVMGEMDKAVSMMQEVFSKTGNQKAYSAYNRLVQERKEFEKAQEQLAY